MKLKPCEVCGTEIPIPRWYRPSKYAKRRFCSRQCSGDGHQLRVRTFEQIYERMLRRVLQKEKEKR